MFGASFALDGRERSSNQGGVLVGEADRQVTPPGEQCREPGAVPFVRERVPATRIVVVTGFDDERDARELIRIGVQGYS